MERPNLSVIGKIIKEKWNCADFMSTSNHHDHQCEFPWALKSYACSFCKRQFKSAQALGGHMNIHRRERARLRLFPTLTVADQLDNNPSSPNPNPNPKFSLVSPSSSTLSAKFLPHHNYMTPRSVLSLDHPLTSSSLPDHDPLPSTEKDMKMIFNFPRSSTSTIPLLASSQGSHSPNTTTKSMKEVLVFEDGDLKGFSRKDDCFKAFKTENIIQTLDLQTGLRKDHKEDVDLELRLGYF